MTDEQLIEYKNLSMQDGKLNLSWFADYVQEHIRNECADLCDFLWETKSAQAYECATAIRERKEQ